MFANFYVHFPDYQPYFDYIRTNHVLFCVKVYKQEKLFLKILKIDSVFGQKPSQL